MFQYTINFTEQDGIDERAVRIFLEAAQVLDVTIVVRAISPGSLKYLGRPGFQSRLQDCQPKTAENTGSTGVGGLVVSPFMRADCFPNMANTARSIYRHFVLHQQASEKKYADALQVLTDRQQGPQTQQNTAAEAESQTKTVSPYSSRFVMHPLDARLNMCFEAGLSPYGVETQGRYRGVLKHRGSPGIQSRYVCGDWNLKDIFRTPAEAWKPVLQENRSSRKYLNSQHRAADAGIRETAFGNSKASLETATTAHFKQVAQFVNNAYNCPVVNHDEEVQQADHTNDEVFVFCNASLLALQLQTYSRSVTAARNAYLPKCFLVKGQFNIAMFYECIGRNLAGRFSFPNADRPFS